MRKLIYILPLAFALSTQAQTYKEKAESEGPHKFTTVSNDPFKTRRYTLSNGLTVITSINKNEPRIQTLIAVKAGSTTDPADNTGLAHYLEHLMFKGTKKIGTVSYSVELPWLDQIDDMYDKYNATKDPAKRKAIYHKIDSLSLRASRFAVANDYDKLMQELGAQGTNAFTSYEQTVYVNDIPSNNLDKWLEVEAERFRDPVFRIFHTELEAVYEEKNIGLDNDNNKAWEMMMAGLFKAHPYGTQTTIGTVEHLKNPSLRRIREYFNLYYQPSNMAIVLSGDFDPDQAIEHIEKHFASWQNHESPAHNYVPEEAMKGPIELSVGGPDAEFISLGYRFPGAGSRDAMLLKLVTELLSNGKGGLFDLDLVKGQKVLSVRASNEIMRDHSYIEILAKPKTGQSLPDLKAVVLEDLKKLADGNFEEDLIKAVIANNKVSTIQNLMTNQGRAYTILDAFILNRTWADYLTEMDEMAKVTKKDIITFANKYFKDYVLVYKKQSGQSNMLKVEKPEITPVEINRDAKSVFDIEFATRPKSAEIKPVFIDFAKEISQAEPIAGVKTYYIQNKENELFNLYLVWDIGKEHLKTLPLAIQYLKYLGTDKYTSEQLNTELYKLACTFNISAGNRQVYVTLSGPNENLEKAWKLLEDLFAKPKSDPAKFKEFISLTEKTRADNKLNKRTIMSGLRSYALFGPSNPFNNNLSRPELAALTENDLMSMLKQLQDIKHKVYYFGPDADKKFQKNCTALHQMKPTKEPMQTLPVRYAATDTTIYFAEYDMVQAEIMWVRGGSTFRVETVPTANLFQEYYGGGMGSVVFQTIRESKALAYSCYLRYMTPEYKDDESGMLAYIGTQADKLPQAITAMNELLDKMPESGQLLETSRSSILSQISTERIINDNIFFADDAALKLGQQTDPREAVYNQVATLGMGDVKTFFNTTVKGSGTYNMALLGSMEKLKMADLRKFGHVKTATLEQVFGY